MGHYVYPKDALSTISVIVAGGTVVAQNPFDTASQFIVPVDVTDTPVLGANSARNYALLVNFSDVTIYLFFGTPGAITDGIPVTRGNNYEINATNLYRGEIFAIHLGSGTKNLHVTEG